MRRSPFLIALSDLIYNGAKGSAGGKGFPVRAIDEPVRTALLFVDRRKKNLEKKNNRQHLCTPRCCNHMCGGGDTQSNHARLFQVVVEPTLSTANICSQFNCIKSQRIALLYVRRTQKLLKHDSMKSG